jgi:hypothetical protein
MSFITCAIVTHEQKFVAPSKKIGKLGIFASIVVEKYHPHPSTPEQFEVYSV